MITIQMKKPLRETQTLRALAVVGFGTKTPGKERPREKDPGRKTRVKTLGERPRPPATNTQTHRQDRLQYTAPLASAQCKHAARILASTQLTVSDARQLTETGTANCRRPKRRSWSRAVCRSPAARSPGSGVSTRSCWWRRAVPPWSRSAAAGGDRATRRPSAESDRRPAASRPETRSPSTPRACRPRRLPLPAADDLRRPCSSCHCTSYSRRVLDRAAAAAAAARLWRVKVVASHNSCFLLLVVVVAAFLSRARVATSAAYSTSLRRLYINSVPNCGRPPAARRTSGLRHS